MAFFHQFLQNQKDLAIKKCNKKVSKVSEVDKNYLIVTKASITN